MLSRVLGLVREMLQSRLIGAGMEQSAFTLAFAIPNMARKLFGEGALTAAFVPVFRGEVERDGLVRAERLARAVLTMVMLLLGSVVAIAMASLAGCVFLLELSPRVRLTCELVFILLPYMLAICGAAFGMGVLNALGRFKASSFMSSLLNIVWISALALLSFFPGMSVAARIRFVAGAILLGGFVQFVYMMRCMARAGVRPRPLFAEWRTANVRLVWRNLGIAAAGAGAIQANYALDQALAWLAAPWAAGVIGYAERLMDLPLGVVGVAFGTVLLPTFAGNFARGDLAGARKVMSDSVQSMLFVMLPAGAGLALLAPEVTRVIYEGGSFDAIATVRVARALAVYAIGLGFFGLQKSFIPLFQAQNDMKTPLRVSLTTVALNAVLNVLAVWLLPCEWRHVGLAASTVVCAAVGVGLLFLRARAVDCDMGLAGCRRPVLKMLLAALVMALVLHWVRPWTSRMGGIPALAALVFVGAVSYLAVLLLVRGLPSRHLLRFRRR